MRNPPECKPQEEIEAKRKNIEKAREKRGKGEQKKTKKTPDQNQNQS